MRKIPAMIDGKDVSLDWIDEIFDGCFCIMSGKQAVGFVDEKPVYCYWENNRIWWKPMNELSADETLEEIKDRLKYWEDHQTDLFSEFYTFKVKVHFIEQHFFWKCED